MVFIGPFEQHSNEIGWREYIADVVAIPEDADGHVDQAVLASRLVEYVDRPMKIGSFSAASNVTGILSDTAGISRLLHEHGALAFWDCAAAAPYVDCSFNVQERDMATGTVKWFNATKGFGFIQPSDGGKDVFVHISAVERAGLNGLNEGQKVDYEIATERGRSAAVNLRSAD